MPNFLQTLNWLKFWKKANNQILKGHDYFTVITYIEDGKIEVCVKQGS